MTLHPSRYRIALGVFTLAVVLTTGALVGVAQSAHPAWAFHDPHQMESLVQDMKIVVRHRDNGVSSYTYHRFAPTQIRRENDTLIIEGSVTEAPAEKIADVTIRLKVAKPPAPPKRDYAGAWWYEDQDRINGMH